MDFLYPVVLDKARGGGFVVRFPDVPEALTQGEDVTDALQRASRALETALEFYTEAGRSLPKASRPKRNQPRVCPPALSCMKVAVYQAMHDQKIRKSQLARKLRWHTPQVDRLLDLRHASKVQQVEAALSALNQRIYVRVA